MCIVPSIRCLSDIKSITSTPSSQSSLERMISSCFNFITVSKRRVGKNKFTDPITSSLCKIEVYMIVIFLDSLCVDFVHVNCHYYSIFVYNDSQSYTVE